MHVQGSMISHPFCHFISDSYRNILLYIAIYRCKKNNIYIYCICACCMYIMYIYVFCAGPQPVHEEKVAGQFMPGSAQCPIEKLPERDLKLLGTRTNDDEASIEEKTLVYPPDEIPAPKVSVVVPPVAPKPSVEKPAVEVAAVAEKPRARVPSPPSPGTISMASKATSKSNASSKDTYAKYKDGSYWKILVLIVFPTSHYGLDMLQIKYGNYLSVLLKPQDETILQTGTW